MRPGFEWAFVLLLGGVAGCNGTRDEPDEAPAAEWYRPPAGATWQWQLLGPINTSYDADIYDIDLFDAPDATLQVLHAAGRRVICYFSAGSGEDWRPDYGDFAPGDLGSPLDGWAGERWLDVRSPTVMAVVEARLDRAAGRGCDAVEPDNVDGFANDSGFDLTASDQAAFNRRVAAAAHVRGLGVGLKNDGDQAAALVDDFDFMVNEQCLELDECEALRPFTDAGKAVFNAEYPGDAGAARTRAKALCPKARALGIHTLFLPLELDDAFRESCDN